MDIIGLGLPFLLDPKHEGGAVWPVEAREEFFHRTVTEASGKSREAIFFFFLADRVLVRDLGKFFQFPSVSFLFSKGNLSREG